MAKQINWKPRWLYSGHYRFMMRAKQIFQKYDPNVKIVDEGDENIEVELNLSEKDADKLNDELIKFDEWWADEYRFNPYGGMLSVDAWEEME